MKTVTFEHIENTINEVLKLQANAQYAKAAAIASAKLIELRSAWGYDGKTETQKGYISDLNRLRARNCRMAMGV